MGKGRESRKKDGRLPVGRKGPSRGSPSRETCRVKPEIGPGKTKSGKDLRFGVRSFAADAFYGGLAVSRLPAGGSDIGVFPPVFCRLTRKSRHGCGLSPERILSWLRGDGVGLLPPDPGSMSSEREGRKDGFGRLSNRTCRAGRFRSVQDGRRRAERAGRPVFRFLFRFDEEGRTEGFEPQRNRRDATVSPADGFRFERRDRSRVRVPQRQPHFPF